MGGGSTANPPPSRISPNPPLLPHSRRRISISHCSGNPVFTQFPARVGGSTHTPPGTWRGGRIGFERKGWGGSTVDPLIKNGMYALLHAVFSVFWIIAPADRAGYGLPRNDKGGGRSLTPPTHIAFRTDLSHGQITGHLIQIYYFSCRMNRRCVQISIINSDKLPR